MNQHQLFRPPLPWCGSQVGGLSPLSPAGAQAISPVLPKAFPGFSLHDPGDPALWDLESAAQQLPWTGGSGFPGGAV